MSPWSLSMQAHYGEQKNKNKLTCACACARTSSRFDFINSIPFLCSATIICRSFSKKVLGGCF